MVIKDGDSVNLADAFSKFDECWSPKIVGALNGQHVKIAKFEGSFPWHQHDEEDELFLVIEGRITIKLEDRDIHLEAGEFTIVPKGVRHQPMAEAVAHVLMMEPSSTVNTGAEVNDHTKEAVWL